MDPRPIGLFDSGVGGLSVLAELRELCPGERFIYFADTAWFPYGGRPAAELRKRAFAITRKLLDLDCKLIVVACNTASAAALADLREAFDVSFIGMVPGLKPAVERSSAGSVVVLATAGTLGGALYNDVSERFARNSRIVEVAAANLAELVEQGAAGTAASREAVRSALEGPVADGADTVVLGCTHFHFLAYDIEAEFPNLRVIDTARPVAEQARTVLRANELEAPAGGQGSLDVIVTAGRERFFGVMESLGFHREATRAAAG